MADPLATRTMALPVSPHPLFVRGERQSRGQINIAFVTPDMSLGGIDTVNCSLADGLPRDRYNVEAITYAWDPIALATNKAHYDNVILTRVGQEYRKPPPDALLRLLTDVYADRRYDLIVTANSTAPNLAARERGGVKIIEYWHGVCGWNMEPKPADRIICVSHASAATVQEHRATECPVTVIHNAVDVAALAGSPVGRAEAKARFGLQDAEKVMLYCGRFSDEKCPEDAIRVAGLLHRRSPGWRTLLCGAMYRGERNRYVSLAEREGLVWGHDLVWVELPRTEVIWAYRAADCMLSPSREEGLGMAILEAMAAGVPLVVTGIGGSLEAVGDTALLAPVGDPKSMAGQVERLFTDEGLAQSKASAAQARVRAKFDLPQQRNAFNRVLEEVLNNV